MSETEKVLHLKGGNMEIDLLPNPQVTWEQDRCPWNLADGTSEHRCAIKNVSLCKYFRGIKPLDTVLCAYPLEAEVVLC